MATLARFRIALADWPGAPGVCTLHFSPGTGFTTITTGRAESVAEDLTTALTAMSDVLVPGMTWEIEDDVALFASETGEIVDILTLGTGPYTGTGSGADAKTSRDTQVCMALKTNDFLNGRRLQGRFFWGPVTGSALDTSGNVNSTVRAVWPPLFDFALSGTSPNLCVWHRPTAAAPSSGTWGDVTLVSANTVPGTLRSRKT